MPVLITELPPVLKLVKKRDAQALRRFTRVTRLVRTPLKLPAWAVVAAVLLVGLSSFLAGRLHPAHHYVSYFGYPMVLDTNTGKACYAAPPRPSDAAPAQDASFATDASGDGLNATTPAGPPIPICGNE